MTISLRCPLSLPIPFSPYRSDPFHPQIDSTTGNLVPEARSYASQLDPESPRALTPTSDFVYTLANLQAKHHLQVGEAREGTTTRPRGTYISSRLDSVRIIGPYVDYIVTHLPLILTRTALPWCYDAQGWTIPWRLLPLRWTGAVTSSLYLSPRRCVLLFSLFSLGR